MFDYIEATHKGLTPTQGIKVNLVGSNPVIIKHDDELHPDEYSKIIWIERENNRILVNVNLIASVCIITLQE